MPDLTLKLSNELMQRLLLEAERMGTDAEQRVLDILEGSVAPATNLDPAIMSAGLDKLSSLVRSIPAVSWVAASSAMEPFWWVKLTIDIDSPIAWNVVQELGFALNYMSLDERLPTVFMPVSAPPYMNGGPKEFLNWAIECSIPFVDAGYIADVLQARLPNPITDEAAWLDSEDN